MTDQTRRNILRYGIAIDLVIVATGVGMLVPAPATLLVAVFALATALSVWRGGWKGGAVALLLSGAVLPAVFPERIDASHLVAFVALSAIGGAAVWYAARPRSAMLEVSAAAAPVGAPVVVEDERQDFAHKPLAPVVPMPQRDEDEEERERRRREKRQEEEERRAEGERRAAEDEEHHGRGEDRAAEDERQRIEAARRATEEEQQRIEAERRAAEEARQRVEAERRAAEEEQQRIEAERRATEEEQRRIEAERRAAEEARQRVEAERRAAEEEQQRIDAARRATEEEQQRIEVERRAAEEERQRIEAERRAAEEERRRIEAERRAAGEERERIEAEHRAAGEERRRAEEERQRIARELEERLAREREELEQRLAAERKAAEDDLRRQLEREREAMRARAERELAAEREMIERETTARRRKLAAARPKVSLFDTIAGWFRREAAPRPINLKTKRVNGNGNTSASRRAAGSSPGTGSRRTAAAAAATKPRVLFIERRRATADVATAKLRQRGVEVEVVERWVDAVDEMFRFRPNALFLDVEHPEFEKIHRTLMEKTTQLPIVITGRSSMAAPPGVRYAAYVPRPYDADEVTRLAQLAFTRPEELLAEQTMPRPAPAPKPAPRPAAPPQTPAAHATHAQPPTPPTPPAAPSAPRPTAQAQQAAPAPAVRKAASGEAGYEVSCFHCRVPFDAAEADWCSCLTKERTLVCTNCLSCFCKAPPAYKEKFWVEAPARLFERKTAEARRQEALLPANPPKDEVTRPLVLCVEDDEEIQAIVQRVCTNLGYGFIWANNGQDGLDAARDYKPNLILSDAFMPRLDGREMCRLLKEEGADCPMVVMTGLYTDTKYRSEAVKRFHVDDYIAKPVAITDLINLLQKHLEGVTGLPVQEDLHELHRRQVEDHDERETAPADNDVPLAEILDGTVISINAVRPPRAAKKDASYMVSCFNCQLTFDATRAEWCSCVGRDNTLVCEHCGGCFCKAPAAYRERFWIDAPPSLFERKMIGSKRNLSARSNPVPAEVKRPLILLVEDDENVQLIVRTVVSSMGYGFVVGANGQEGLTLAREYNPDLILSDAFMPKLDGREMCRLLKEDPATARTKAIIMTGLYTDRKYRNEALDYFKVDDYVAKPLAVDDLIKLFKKHLPQEIAAAR